MKNKVISIFLAIIMFITLFAGSYSVEANDKKDTLIKDSKVNILLDFIYNSEKSNQRKIAEYLFITTKLINNVDGKEKITCYFDNLVDELIGSNSNNMEYWSICLVCDGKLGDYWGNKIKNNQNSDGGFGLAKNYASDILDTEIALRALQEVGEKDAMHNAARYVVSCQNEDGGFGYQPGLASNAELSAEIANILADCVNSDQSLSYEISEDIVELRNYLDNNAVALDELNSDELGKVYQHFNTALFKLKMDKEYDVTSYYDLQAENGGVFDDPLATAMYLELIVREQNTIKASINGITFTTDEGAMASVYNSYENVNIVVDSTFSEDEGYLKVEVVNPNGDVEEIDTDNLVFETSDKEEGSYTVNAYVINKKNEEIATKNTNVFTIHRTFVAEGLDVWFTDCTYVYDENWENINENYGNRISSAQAAIAQK